MPSTNAAQYTGRENDTGGLYYYRARFYHPGLQRFISEDPSGFAAGDPNLYAYTFNAPTRYRDPSGRFVVPLVLCAAGAGGSAAADWMGGRKIDPVKAAMWCAAGAGLGFAGPAIGAALGYGAGSAAAAGVAAASAAGGGFSRTEVEGLRELFGRGVQGANSLLERLQSGEVNLPETVTPDTLRRYREIAESAITAGKDTLGVQEARRQAIDLLLRK
jgi:RHS repeat-associated protein